VVTFNGEIYNYMEHRERLAAKGVVFRSRSDTEVLPHLFRDLDPGPLSTLNGMFAFGIWRPDLRELLLARDAFGKKPLYVYQDENYFAFASEIQAFYALPTFDQTINQDTVAEYLLLGYCPGPGTIYKRIRQIEPGSFERFRFTGKTVETLHAGRFFRFAAVERPSVAQIDKGALKQKLKQSLVRAVDQRMISDVPLGAFLSGGVDSSLVVAIVRRELQREINTYSVGFEGSADSEHQDARAIAQHLEANHHDEMIKPDGIALINHIASVLDQPNGDSSCLPTYLLSEFARKQVTVILSGDGGDELFGGYGRYRDTMNEWANRDLIRQNHGIDPAAAQPADLYMSLRWHIWLPAQVDALMDGLPSAVRARVAQWRALLNDPATSIMHRMRTLDANLYMPGAVLAKVDRMGMQHALEVRSPLLDPQFAEIAMGLSEGDCWAPPNVTKLLLKEIASEYLPREWMFRAKKGFGLPANAWAMDDVIALCGQTLNTPNTRLRDYLNTKALSKTVENQSRKDQFSIYQMWPLLMLELWLRAQPAKIDAAREFRRAA
ncbi:MAG TPA: asparagine synthase (glutamine-hydrolyzing), partial [Hyphomonadaceae bacterium]|nr:asparagine synthase (glutamine-hydrolyzing) [Hyphomonadaceae bacterium]